jgi:hypothetical protein
MDVGNNGSHRKGGIQAMKYFVILLILVIAGYYVYQYLMAPSPQNLQRALTRDWFSPESPAYPELKDMVARFEVAPDFSVTVHLSENYRMMADSPARVTSVIRTFVSKESPKPSAVVTFLFQGKDIEAR